MRKRFLILVLVLVVIAGMLSVAKFVQLPNHITLPGGANVVGSQGATINGKTLDAMGITAPQRPAGSANERE